MPVRDGHRPVVLVVDDDDILARSLRRVLAPAGLDVVVASTLAEAHAMLARERVDVVLTDFQLPDGFGVELAECVSAARPDLGVVVMSAAPEAVVRALGPRPGAVLAKPFAIDALLATLGGALQPYWSTRRR